MKTIFFPLVLSFAHGLQTHKVHNSLSSKNTQQLNGSNGLIIRTICLKLVLAVCGVYVSSIEQTIRYDLAFQRHK